MDALSESDFNLSESLKSYPTFASMGLKDNLLKGIYAYGFEKPSLIQQKTIKQIILGRDLIAQSYFFEFQSSEWDWENGNI